MKSGLKIPFIQPWIGKLIHWNSSRGQKRHSKWENIFNAQCSVFSRCCSNYIAPGMLLAIQKLHKLINIIIPNPIHLSHSVRMTKNNINIFHEFVFSFAALLFVSSEKDQHFQLKSFQFEIHLKLSKLFE